MTAPRHWARAATIAAVVGLAGLSAMAGCASVNPDNGVPHDASAGDASGVGLGGQTGAGSGGSGFSDAGGIGDGFPGRGGSSGLGGASSGSGGTTGAAGSTGCQVSLRVVAPPPPNPIEAGMGARLRVAGSVVGAAVTPPVWIWTAKLDNPSSTIATTATDDSGAIIEVPVERPGSYQITALIMGDSRCQGLLVAVAVPPQPASFVLRATAAGLPVQDSRISLSPSDPQPVADIRLDPGVVASVAPQRADLNGGPLASYVRVTSPGSDFSVEADTARGPLSTRLLPSVTYDVLIIPTEAYAPDQFSGSPGAWPQPLQIDPGVHVTARALAPDGSAVVGARMVLHRGTLPSTLATSDASGAMELWARAGTLAAVVVPPPSSGLPRATVGMDGGAGIVLGPGVASLDLAMTWDAIATASLAIDVLAPDGTTPIAGARVRVTSQGAVAPVGMLVASPAGGTSVSLPASGSTDVEVASDATGTATFPPLPIGGYDVTIIPPAAASPAAITSTSLTLARGGLAPSVTLARKVLLTGMLLPASDSAGALVTAVDRSVTAAGAVTSTTVAADGSYTLSVDPGRGYELLVEPAAGVLRGRTVLTILSSNGTTVVSPRTLPVGHLVGGRVTAAGNAVAGALIQVFCQSISSQCLDPTFSLTDAISGADGTFNLLLPEPPPLPPPS
jgi:hypothetical protein